jgi:hypothetical protein
MSESLFSRAAAVAEPPANTAEPAEQPQAAYAEAPRGIALRRTAPRRTVAEAPSPASDAGGAVLAELAVDRATPAPRGRGWRSIFGGGR